MSSVVKSKDIKKAQYYVCYLGWHECRGLFGPQFVLPVLRGLIEKWRNDKNIPLTKLTLQVCKKDVKITQETDHGKQKKADKIKYPPIPSKDITFACQGEAPDHDTVGVIYLGFNPQTHNAVHVHGYRCDSPETASLLAHHFRQLSEISEHRERFLQIERDLIEQGQILPRSWSQSPSGSDGRGSFGSSAGSTGSGTDAKELHHQHNYSPLYDSIQSELREKLKGCDGAPILLPPVDYDTISRSHGEVKRKRKSLQHDSLAPTGAFIRKIDTTGNMDANRNFQHQQHKTVDDGYYSCDGPYVSGYSPASSMPETRPRLHYSLPEESLRAMRIDSPRQRPHSEYPARMNLPRTKFI